MKRPVFFLPLLFALGACSSWPDEGRGGLAERRAVADPTLQALVDRFERQRQRGADRLAAGLVDETKTMLVRAQRNAAAGIADDFAVDLDYLKTLLDQIERHIPGR